MSDETTVDAGSETSGETADTAQADVAAETTTSETATAEQTVDAGGAADETQSAETPVAPDAQESRTGFAEKGLRAGDECKCPDGRKGTVHSFDAGFVCIPNADQG